jgi:hypothetical protein
MSTKIPRDALVIQAILKDMGITEYEPRVINQLLEFIYRKPRNSKIERLNDFSLTVLILGYVTTVLDDAKAYAKLAVSMQMEQSFTSPPPREVYRIYYRNKLFGHILIYFTFRFSWKLQDQKIAHLYLQ